MPRPVGKPHLGQQFPGMRFQLVVDLLAVLLVVRALFRQQFTRQHHILQRRILRKKVEILEHQSEVQPLFAQHGLALGAGIVRAPQRFKQRSNVVLPEPEDPIMASASPFCKSNEISRSTAVLPKLLPIPATSNNAIAVPP